MNAAKHACACVSYKCDNSNHRYLCNVHVCVCVFCDAISHSKALRYNVKIVAMFQYIGNIVSFPHEQIV